jgi:hypothetical protein
MVSHKKSKKARCSGKKKAPCNASKRCTYTRSKTVNGKRVRRGGCNRMGGAVSKK